MLGEQVGVGIFKRLVLVLELAQLAFQVLDVFLFAISKGPLRCAVLGSPSLYGHRQFSAKPLQNGIEHSIRSGFAIDPPYSPPSTSSAGAGHSLPLSSRSPAQSGPLRVAS